MLSIALIISLLWVMPTSTYAARSLSARKVRGTAQAKPDRYDRSITTFSPEGRLLQLEYALIAAEERGRGLTVCVECDGVVIFAFPSSDDDDDYDCNITDAKTLLDAQSITPVTIDNANDNDDDKTQDCDDLKDANTINLSEEEYQPPTRFASSSADHNPTHNTKIHRLSPTNLLLTSGLAGDARILASAFRRISSSWTHVQYGEVVSTRELAKEMGKTRHSIGLRPGARVLGVIGMLIGLDDVDDKANGLGVEVRMYRSLPGGTMDRCNVCCNGGGADSAGNAARKDATTTLLSVLSSKMGADDDDNDDDADKSEKISNHKLQQVVEEVGRVALKHHSESHDAEELPNPLVNKKNATVDIWMVRAASVRSPTKAFINPHRYLGKASMETRYARRVAFDQLSTAAQCLITKKQ